MDTGNPQRTGVERAGLAQANTARTDAGLRAGDRTGLGDCQSKGWPRRQRYAGSPCQTLSPCPSGLPEPKPSTPLAAKMTIIRCRHPSPCLAGVAGPRRDGLSIPEHSGHEVPMTDFDLEARSLSELKKMPQGRRQGNLHLSRSAEGGSPR